MYSKNRIGNKMLFPNYQSLFFQINSISLIESEEFKETSNNDWTTKWVIISAYLS